jgi:hypothetical protein
MIINLFQCTTSVQETNLPISLNSNEQTNIKNPSENNTKIIPENNNEITDLESIINDYKQSKEVQSPIPIINNNQIETNNEIKEENNNNTSEQLNTIEKITNINVPNQNFLGIAFGLLGGAGVMVYDKSVNNANQLANREILEQHKNETTSYIETLKSQISNENNATQKEYLEKELQRKEQEQKKNEEYIKNLTLSKDEYNNLILTQETERYNEKKQYKNKKYEQTTENNKLIVELFSNLNDKQSKLATEINNLTEHIQEISQSFKKILEKQYSFTLPVFKDIKDIIEKMIENGISFNLVQGESFNTIKEMLQTFFETASNPFAPVVPLHISLCGTAGTGKSIFAQYIIPCLLQFSTININLEQMAKDPSEYLEYIKKTILEKLKSDTPPVGIVLILEEAIISESKMPQNLLTVIKDFLQSNTLSLNTDNSISIKYILVHPTNTEIEYESKHSPLYQRIKTIHINNEKINSQLHNNTLLLKGLEHLVSYLSLLDYQDIDKKTINSLKEFYIRTIICIYKKIFDRGEDSLREIDAIKNKLIIKIIQITPLIINFDNFFKTVQFNNEKNEFYKKINEQYQSLKELYKEQKSLEFQLIYFIFFINKETLFELKELFNEGFLVNKNLLSTFIIKCIQKIFYSNDARKQIKHKSLSDIEEQIEQDYNNLSQMKYEAKNEYNSNLSSLLKQFLISMETGKKICNQCKKESLNKIAAETFIQRYDEQIKSSFTIIQEIYNNKEEIFENLEQSISNE